MSLNNIQISWISQWRARDVDVGLFIFQILRSSNICYKYIPLFKTAGTGCVFIWIMKGITSSDNSKKEE